MLLFEKPIDFETTLFVIKGSKTFGFSCSDDRNLKHHTLRTNLRPGFRRDNMADLESKFSLALLDTNGRRILKQKPTPHRCQPPILTMTQTTILISGKDTAWMLLQVTSIAALYFIARKFLNLYQWSPSGLEGPSRKQTVSPCELVIPVLSSFWLISHSFRIPSESVSTERDVAWQPTAGFYGQDHASA